MNTKNDKLPPEADAFIKMLDEAKLPGHERISIGMWIAISRAFHPDSKLSHEQRLDLWEAGMHAYRSVCVHSYLTEALLGPEGLVIVQKAGGMPSALLAEAVVMQSRMARSASQKFLTLCEMLD